MGSELNNLTLATAEKIIDEHSLLIGQIEYTEAAKLLNENEQYVLLTDPVAGTLVSRRSSIKLYVGTVEDAQRGGTPTPPTMTPTHLLSLVVDGSGRVEGGGSYSAGVQVNVRAFPAEGFAFVKWVDSTNNTVSTTSEFAYLMPNRAETLKAVFAPVNSPDNHDSSSDTNSSRDD